MKSSQHRVSLGAVALLVCLALPAGLLSLLAEMTTGEQIDRADLVIAGRVASLQDLGQSEVTAVEFAVNEVLWGASHAAHLTVSVEGPPAVQVGDTVVAIIARHPATLLGALQLQKNPRTLAWEILSPVSGMRAQGLAEGSGAPLPLFQEAVRLRKGQAPGAGSGGGSNSAAEGSPLEPDAYEPNNTLATATHVTGLFAPSLLTGNPTFITGLTIVPSSDVDFFSFESPPLVVLHAETHAITGLQAPDTLLGLFNSPAGDLLAWDEDGGEGTMSRLTEPLEAGGTFAVAIESSPDDTPPDFLGDEGITTGFYSLSLELEIGSYLWNQLDLIFGVSPDGTFIEDFIGFKEIGGPDVFLVDVPADGWAVDFDAAAAPPVGITHVYGGGGDQLTDPGFVNPLLPISFELASYEDFAGFNRRGFAEAVSLVNYMPTGEDPRGLLVDHEYQVSVGDSTVVSRIQLTPATHAPLSNVFYARISDVNLFGPGSDQFFWSFTPQSPLKAFAVDGLTNVGNLQPPAMPFGNATGDLQTAVQIDAGSLTAPAVFEARTAFTYVKGFPTSVLALNEAVRRLRIEGIDSWVVAVDADPSTGLFAAFGTGLGEP